MRHDSPEQCTHGWKQVEPTVYDREYLAFRCGCPSHDVHMVRRNDSTRTAEYERYAQ